MVLFAGRFEVLFAGKFEVLSAGSFLQGDFRSFLLGDIRSFSLGDLRSFLQETANFMMFGRELRLPGALCHPDLYPEQTCVEFVSQNYHRLQAAYELLREQQRKIRTVDDRQEPLYQTGD